MWGFEPHYKLMRSGLGQTTTVTLSMNSDLNERVQNGMFSH